MAQKKPKPPTPKQEAALEATATERLRELAGQDLTLARIVAKNSSAPEDLLTELAHTGDTATRKAVTTNPNTPKETLLELGTQFPEELLDNPVFDLLLLENPNLLADMPKSSLKSLVKRETVPKSFLDWAVNHADDDVLIALLRNPQLSYENLTKLTKHSNSQIVEVAKLHVNWGEEIENPDELVQQAIKHSGLNIPKGKEEIFSYLSVEMIPEKWLDSVLTSVDSDVRRNVASNPNTPVSLLEKLATDSDKYVRREVSSNPSSTKEIKEKVLLFNEYYETRKIPIHILEELATQSTMIMVLYVQ